MFEVANIGQKQLDITLSYFFVIKTSPISSMINFDQNNQKLISKMLSHSFGILEDL